MQYLKQQRGFLLIASIILIVAIGVLVAALSFMFTSSSRSSTDFLTSKQAFYAAETGLEEALYQLNRIDAGNRVSCADLSTYVNVPLGAGIPGTYTLQGSVASATSPATLSVGINASTMIIPVTSLAPYSDSGRVIIDSEAIDYTSTSSSGGVCGTAPCLTGAMRGANGTTATAHSAGAVVGQNDCFITSTGTVPSVTLDSERTLTTSSQSNAGWVAGQVHAFAENILYWDGAGFTVFGPSVSVPNVQLHSIKMNSYTNGWMVGNRSGSDPTIIRWNGSSWTRVFPNVPGALFAHLYAVDCVNEDDCWAVGQRNAGNLLFLHWDGVDWSRFTQGGPNINRNLFGVSCVASNDCWAVGQRTTGGGANLLFLHWDGVDWNKVNLTGTPILRTLRDVYCVNGSDCWAVGARYSGRALLVHWNGSQWTAYTTLNHFVTLRAVTCTAGNNCWAVGDPLGGDAYIAHYNGTTWSRVIPDVTVPSRRLNEIDCLSENDCWAVGDDQGGNVLTIHWDGSTWTRVIATSSPVNADLDAVDLLGPSGGNVESVWQEDFH